MNDSHKPVPGHNNDIGCLCSLNQSKGRVRESDIAKICLRGSRIISVLDFCRLDSSVWTGVEDNIGSQEKPRRLDQD